MKINAAQRLLASQTMTTQQYAERIHDTHLKVVPVKELPASKYGYKVGVDKKAAETVIREWKTLAAKLVKKLEKTSHGYYGTFPDSRTHTDWAVYINETVNGAELEIRRIDDGAPGKIVLK